MKYDDSGNVVDDEGKILLAAKAAATPEEIQAQVDALVDEKLKKNKAQMDSLNTKLEEAQRESASIKAKQKQTEIDSLTAAGKHTEAAQARIIALEENNKVLQEQNTQYTRNFAVRDALSGLSFRNERAMTSATRDIISELVQDDNGQWTHKTGVSIKDFVLSYSKDEENQFLFAIKQNSGAGMHNTKGAPVAGKKKLSEMTTEEVLAAATAGTLPKLTRGM